MCVRTSAPDHSLLAPPGMHAGDCMHMLANVVHRSFILLAAPSREPHVPACQNTRVASPGRCPGAPHRVDHGPQNLPQEVEQKFEKFGPVREARIVRNPVNGESRGFGFVAMKYEEDVDAVGPPPSLTPSGLTLPSVDHTSSEEVNKCV